MIHLPSASVSDDFKLQLEARNNKQFLVMEEKMSPDFLDYRLFLQMLPNYFEDEDKFHIKQAIRDHSAELNTRFCGDKNDDEDGMIHMISEYELPFVCDDVFTHTGENQRRDGTTYDFMEWTIMGVQEDQENNVQVAVQNADNLQVLTGEELPDEFSQVIDKCKMYFVRLVAAEKVKETKIKTTPSRKVATQIVHRRTRR